MSIDCANFEDDPPGSAQDGPDRPEASKQPPDDRYEAERQHAQVTAGMVSRDARVEEDNGTMAIENWREINLANWESRVPVHTGPGGYNLAAFDTPDHISDVVRYDLPRLGRLDGLDVVHLQCHIGTDTVSLARLGARSVVGLDFSPSALAAARGIAERVGNTVRFVDSDAYDAVERLGPERFDLVYTGIGALCWLPDMVVSPAVV